MKEEMRSFQNDLGGVRAALSYVFVEVFFAVLPLLIYSFMVIGTRDGGLTELFFGPEIAMTACVLYGLSLARFQVGFFKETKKNDNTRRGETAALISVITLAGVIFTVVLIAKLVSVNSLFLSLASLVNFFVSVVCFVWIGGYGISRSQ